MSRATDHPAPPVDPDVVPVTRLERLHAGALTVLAVTLIVVPALAAVTGGGTAGDLALPVAGQILVLLVLGSITTWLVRVTVIRTLGGWLGAVGFVALILTLTSVPTGLFAAEIGVDWPVRLASPAMAVSAVLMLAGAARLRVEGRRRAGNPGPTHL